MASVFVSTPAEVVLIDSRVRPGTVTLPLTNSIPFRVLNFKDQYGTFSNSTFTVVTQVGESFDDGTTTKTFSNAFSYLSLYSLSSKWMVMNATQTVQQTISSLTVNQLTFGTGAGWVQFGPVQATVVSTIQVQAQTAFVNELNIGNVSTLNTLDYYGLFGNYNNTVLAEISTGAGTQEFLVFKGSSASDRVRVQTTGNFVVETGVSARLFNSNTTQTLSNVTPAFIINTSSNVGIQTATPGATLDVAGTGRFQFVSTQALQISSINGTVYTAGGGSFTGSTIGLSSARIGTSSLVANAIVVPFSSFNPISTFDLNTAVPSSVLAFGTSQTALQSQFYIGDMFNQLNFSTISSPTLLLEQTLPAQNIVTSTFRSSGTFTVPANVTLLNLHLWGSGGAQYPGLGAGGGGAYLTGYLRVVPSQVLNIQVNLGGGGGSQARGGGGTAIFNQASTFTNLIAVAGGGGGGGSFATTIGGGGGVLTGRSGTYRNATSGGAAPGTQTAAGSSSAWQLKGGDGTDGGGGGFWGGGAGENNSVDNVGGGGGSSLFSNLISWSGEDGQNGGLAGGQNTRYYASGFGNCNTTGFNGAAVFAWSLGIRPGNLFETRGPTQTIGFGISQNTSVGLNVSSINPAFALEVNGLASFSTLQGNTVIPTNLLVPYSTINPTITLSTQSIFAMNTISSGTQVAFGTTQAYGPVGKYSQVYAGDLRALRGEYNNTDPLLLLEQDFPLVQSSNVTISVFSTTVTSFVVPPSIFMAKAYLWGQGGNSLSGSSNGASGAFVSGAFTVTPGETIAVAVNYQGGAGVGNGASGGGLTGVFRSSINWSTSIAIAAGGGGGGTFPTTVGGFGGYTDGGFSLYRGGPWAPSVTGGGTQTGGGTGGLGVPGSALRGGNAVGNGGDGGANGGGGGGAGYFGGSGGYYNTVDGMGGGGGSSYIGGLISTSVVLENGVTGTPVGARGAGKFAPFYRSTIADTNNSGFAVIVFPRAFRKANLLEMRAASRSTITGIDYTLAMGVQVPVINSTIALDVGGTGRFLTLSTLALNLSSINGQTFGAPINSTVQGLGSAGYVSTAQLVSTTVGLVDHAELTSTVQGLGTLGYISTASGGTPAALPSIISSFSLLTSSAVISSATIGIMSSLITTASTVTANTVTASTVTTNALNLGTNPSWILTSPIQTLGLSTNTLWADQTYINTGTVTTGNFSTMTTNALTLGTGATWIQTAPLLTTIVSTIVLYANQPFFDTVNVGSVSTMNSLEFAGLYNAYNNTVMAEISTGAGTQELLVFKGSSASDRVRVQTTGNFVVETGVSARLFNSNTTQTLSNLTPAFIITTSSNVGIQTATPGATLDVAGTGRFQTLSSLALFASSIVAPYVFASQFITF
jgi:hypothetical protein